MSADLIKVLFDMGTTATLLVVYGRILKNHETRIRRLESPRALRIRRPRPSLAR